MLVKIETGNKNILLNVKFMRLANSNQDAIKEAYIASKELSLARISIIRNSKVRKLSKKEIEIIERYDENFECIEKIVL